MGDDVISWWMNKGSTRVPRVVSGVPPETGQQGDGAPVRLGPEPSNLNPEPSLTSFSPPPFMPFAFHDETLSQAVNS